MLGNIAGGQEAFAEKPLLFNWGCTKRGPDKSLCQSHEHYITKRTFSGVCNNLEKDIIWGAASTAQPRSMPKHL